VFGGRWTQAALAAWVAAEHFVSLERVGPGNFAALRGRQLPMLYVLVGQAAEAGEAGEAALLARVRSVAKGYLSRLSFVWTRLGTSESAELVRHLRCDPPADGGSFAVLEDFAEEYFYCVQPPLSAERLSAVAEAFLARGLAPDKLRGQEAAALEEAQAGPVAAVVTANLLDRVMRPDRDVVLHVYADFDEQWERTEYEYAKFAELVEEVETVHVAKLEGMRNERPREFPDLGYFPCTWLFPARAKHQPVRFNATSGGFTRERLVRWLLAEASLPFPDHTRAKLLKAAAPTPELESAPPHDEEL